MRAINAVGSYAMYDPTAFSNSPITTNAAVQSLFDSYAADLGPVFHGLDQNIKSDANFDILDINPSLFSNFNSNCQTADTSPNAP